MEASRRLLHLMEGGWKEEREGASRRPRHLIQGGWKEAREAASHHLHERPFSDFFPSQISPSLARNFLAAVTEASPGLRLTLAI